MITRLFFIVLLALAAAGPALAADETFDVLNAGKDSYTNVTVLNKTKNNVFISHAAGMASLKVKDLDTSTQLKLGYQVELPKPKKTEVLLQAADMSKLEEKLESDPRVQEAQAQLVARYGELFETYSTEILYGVVGGVVFLYLLFSLLCRAICMKAAVPPTKLIPLIWLPLFKQIPLLKAAGMSPWWILTSFVPLLSLVTFIIWSFKITQARGKHVAVAVLLLLPVTNIFAFLYLALSRSAGSESGNRNVITLQSTSRREAA